MYHGWYMLLTWQSVKIVWFNLWQLALTYVINIIQSLTTIT